MIRDSGILEGPQLGVLYRDLCYPLRRRTVKPRIIHYGTPTSASPTSVPTGKTLEERLVFPHIRTLSPRSVFDLINGIRNSGNLSNQSLSCMGRCRNSY